MLWEVGWEAVVMPQDPEQSWSAFRCRVPGFTEPWQPRAILRILLEPTSRWMPMEKRALLRAQVQII